MRLLRLTLITCALLISYSQSSEAQSLETFNENRLKLNKQGLLVLGGWSIVNLISSPILANKAVGNERYFHQMNGYWNGVNLIIGPVTGLLHFEAI